MESRSSSAPRKSAADELSPWQSPACILIRQWYEDNGLNKPWDGERINRLCRLLRLTEQELACLVQMDSSNWSRCRKQDKWPAHICLPFYLLEAWHGEMTFGVSEGPIIPIHIPPITDPSDD